MGFFRSTLDRLGYIPKWKPYVDRIDGMRPEDRATYQFAAERTMVDPGGVVAAARAVTHVCRAKVPGAIVECGVWRGGVSMTMLRALIAAGDTSREVFMYDTYEGMPPPGDKDVSRLGESASSVLERNPSAWCRATYEDVLEGVRSVGYPEHLIHMVRGKVEDTIPGTAPEAIALLRLDTDWYDSTKHELEHLFPRLSPRGILIIDDYSAWQGARQAVDEYLSNHVPDLFLAIGEGGIAYAQKFAAPTDGTTVISASR